MYHASEGETIYGQWFVYGSNATYQEDISGDIYKISISIPCGSQPDDEDCIFFFKNDESFNELDYEFCYRASDDLFQYRIHDTPPVPPPDNGDEEIPNPLPIREMAIGVVCLAYIVWKIWR